MWAGRGSSNAQALTYEKQHVDVTSKAHSVRQALARPAKQQTRDGLFDVVMSYAAMHKEGKHQTRSSLLQVKGKRVP